MLLKKYVTQKRLIIFLCVLLLSLALWYFCGGTLPTSYASCLKTHTNDYTRDGLMCSYSPQTYVEYKFCAARGGMIGPGCLITYYNPQFVFPKDLADCLKRVGSTTPAYCDVSIHVDGVYNVDKAEELSRICKSKGGLVFGDSCTVRFSK